MNLKRISLNEIDGNVIAFEFARVCVNQCYGFHCPCLQ